MAVPGLVFVLGPVPRLRLGQLDPDRLQRDAGGAARAGGDDPQAVAAATGRAPGDAVASARELQVARQRQPAGAPDAHLHRRDLREREVQLQRLERVWLADRRDADLGRLPLVALEALADA